MRFGYASPWMPILLGMLAATSSSLEAQWVGRGEVGAFADDNPGNAVEADDVVKAIGTFAEVSAGKAFPFGDGWSLRLEGVAQVEAFSRVQGLDRVSLGLDSALRRKWGIGPFVPWTEVVLAVSREDFRESLRSVWHTQATFRTGKRISPDLDLGAEASVERRVARAGEAEVPGRSGDAFSQSNSGFNLWGELALLPDLYFTLSYHERFGDVTVESTGGADEYSLAKAAESDPTLGPGYFAYRSAGTTRGGKADLLWAYSAKAALDLSYERLVTDSRGDDTYYRNIATLSVKFQF